MDDKQKRKAIFDHVSTGIGKAQIAARALQEGRWDEAYDYLLHAVVALSVAREHINPTRFFNSDYPEAADDER